MVSRHPLSRHPSLGVGFTLIDQVTVSSLFDLRHNLLFGHQRRSARKSKPPAVADQTTSKSNFHCTRIELVTRPVRVLVSRQVHTHSIEDFGRAKARNGTLTITREYFYWTSAYSTRDSKKPIHVIIEAQVRP